MKTILMICLVSSFFIISIAANAAPSWVPKEKREQFDRVIARAKEYAVILKADPKIVDAKVLKKIKDKNGKTKKGIFFVATVKRATLKTEFILEIDSNENIKEIKMDGDKVVIEYESKTSSLGDKIKYGGIGATGGALLTLLLILLI